MNKCCTECDVVLDLLPLYLENMTSKESNEFVEKHIKNCVDCGEVCKAMSMEVDVKPENVKPVKKKNRFITKKKLMIMLLFLLYIALLCGSVAFIYLSLTA